MKVVGVSILVICPESVPFCLIAILISFSVNFGFSGLLMHETVLPCTPLNAFLASLCASVYSSGTFVLALRRA